MTSCSSVPSASRNEPVACRARRATASRADRDVLLAGDPRDHGGELLDRRPAEVEAVAAVDDRRQDLLRLGRGEHEDRVRRRLLEGLEERVPGLRREHVGLVEDVDLVAARDRRVGDVSRRSRMSSTELFDAASISMTSSDVALAIDTHDSHFPHGSIGRAAARSSGRRRGSSPSTSCPCRGSRRRGRRGGPCPAERRCAGCARRAPAPPRRRRCAGGGDGRARGRRTRTIECSGRKGSSRIGRLGVMEGRR